MRRQAILLMAAIGAVLIAASGVALAETFTCNEAPPCYGTPEGDNITGTVLGETIYTYGDIDAVFALEGNDTVYAGPGNDFNLQGNEGSDTVYSGGGGDFIHAAALDSPGSKDFSYGGGGNDEIRAVDGEEDMINCGKGTDTVHYDQALDTIKACENKTAV